MKTFSIKRTLLIIFMLIILAILALTVHFKIGPLSLGLYGSVNTNENVAIHGYDPTSYFISNSAQKGDPAISHTLNNVDWHFASEQNRAAFIADPEKFTPQFGGFCALAVSGGYTADADPEVWHLNDGKLYLFFNEDPKNDWLNAHKDVVTKAESNWSMSL
ncbi:MAG: YHS domain-containing (seleno)protein [Gammaproteobacteria bacterium]